MFWILGRSYFDFLAFYLPGLLSLLLFTVNVPNEFQSLWILILASVLDTGHGYATGIRVFRKGSRDRVLALILLVSILFFGFVWMRVGFPYFFSFVLYFTVYHHIRQFYGLFRIYDRGLTRRWSFEIILFYMLLFLPFVGLHLRSLTSLGVYTAHDLAFWPQPTALLSVQILWGVLLCVLLAFELKRWRSGTTNLPRSLSLFYPVGLQGTCFFLGENFYQVAFPLLISHAVTYLILIGWLARRLKNGSVSVPVMSVWIVMVICVAGIVGATIKGFGAEFSYEREFLSSMTLLWAALSVTPNLWHYVLDGFIWKRKHSDFTNLSTEFH